MPDELTVYSPGTGPLEALTAAELGIAADAAWQSSVEGILHCADCVAEVHRRYEVQQGVANARWQRWLEDRPFGSSTARKLRTIAEDKRIAGLRAQGNEASLPASWTAIHALTTLTDETWDDGVATGTIHPDMTRWQITALKARDNVGRDDTPAKPRAKRIEVVCPHCGSVFEAEVGS